MSVTSIAKSIILTVVAIYISSCVSQKSAQADLANKDYSDEIAFVCVCADAFLSRNREDIEKLSTADADYLTTERLALVSEAIKDFDVVNCKEIVVYNATEKSDTISLDLYVTHEERAFSVTMQKQRDGGYRLEHIGFSAHYQR